MKKIIALLVLMAICCSISQAQPNHYLKVRNEKWALNRINALPEVKAFMKDAKKNHPLVMIAGDPGATNKYYWVKVGINNLGMFRTSDDFFINPKTNKIFIWDQMNVTGNKTMNLVPLQLMRKWGNTPGWAKPHIFVKNKLVVLKE